MVRTKTKMLKAGLVLAAAVAFSHTEISAGRLGNAAAAVRSGTYTASAAVGSRAYAVGAATGKIVLWPVQHGYNGAARGTRNTVGRITVPEAVSSRWNSFSGWFGAHLHAPLNYYSKPKAPATLVGRTRARVAGAFAPVRNGLARAGSAATNNRFARAFREYGFERPMDFVKDHSRAAKYIAGAGVTAGAAYGAYYLYNEMEQAERSIALRDIEARLSSGDLQDATLATLIETRSIKEKEAGAAQKRLARRQRSEGRSYVTHEEQELLGRLNTELGEIDEALVVAYKEDNTRMQRIANVVSHAVSFE